MKLRGHGNGVAIALAALAVVIAGTGTAVAVTATVVHIADPTDSSQVARVDATGHLVTTGAASTVHVFTNVGVGSDVPLTAPTKAKLDITSVTIYNPEENATVANTDFAEVLVQTTVGSSGTCQDADAIRSEVFVVDHTPVGGIAREVYPEPLVVQPFNNKKYCIGMYIYSTDGAAPSGYTYPQVQLTAYVASGTYSGFAPHVRAGSALTR
jgi:hypothetical protein